MKQRTGSLILLFVFGFLAQGVGAADVQMNGGALSSPRGKFTGTVAGPTNIEMNGNVGINGSVAATSLSGDGSALTNLDPAKITSGTANISISGNAATATTASSVTAGGVATSGLADGAVTSAKIAFFGKVAIVATSGGNYSDPAAAINDYATWCGTPSSTDPCLLKIMPGVYDVGASPVVMQPYIDIEGSGENTTIIQGNIDGSLSSGVVNGASNAEIRFLTVKNTGGAAYAYAVYSTSASPKMTNMTAAASGSLQSYSVFNVSSSPIMTNVTVTASGGSNLNCGVYNTSSTPTMTNVTATASGGVGSYGVFNISSSPIMTNVTATANYGVYSDGSGMVKINHSIIKGTINTIYNGSGVTTLVGNAQLDGGAASNSGTLTCAGAYNANYVALDAGCL